MVPRRICTLTFTLYKHFLVSADSHSENQFHPGRPSSMRQTPQISFRSMLFNKFFLFFSMEGGELFARIQERAHNAFTERGKK